MKRSSATKTRTRPPPRDAPSSSKTETTNRKNGASKPSKAEKKLETQTSEEINDVETVEDGTSSLKDDIISHESDYSSETLENVRRLKSLLKLPKARRFAYCEFFYSPVDAQIFLSENEFLSLVRENLPNLRTTNLRRCEWRMVRRLIGRPRRLSVNFLAEERRVLEAKRNKIQSIYRGVVTHLDSDSIDLPSKLPRPLMIGTKVFVKVSGAKDSIFVGTINASEPTGYRVVFEKHDLQTMSCREDQVMATQKLELLSVAYFISTNKANLKAQLPGSSYNFYQQSVASGSTSNQSNNFQGGQMGRKASTKDDKVGNFPVRLLVIVVKMCKLLEHKRSTLKLLKMINDEGVKMHRYGVTFPPDFVTVHAEVTVDLESINKMLRVYSEALAEYKTTLNPQRSRQVPTDKPETLRRTCHNHANQIMKHCSASIDVRSNEMKDIVSMMSSLLLQIRFLGQHAMNSRSCAEEVQILKDSLTELKDNLPPQAYQAFEDGVEIHLKQIFNTLLKVRPSSSVQNLNL